MTTLTMTVYGKAYHLQPLNDGVRIFDEGGEEVYLILDRPATGILRKVDRLSIEDIRTMLEVTQADKRVIHLGEG